MFDNHKRKNTVVLLFLLFCTVIHLSPLAITGPTYWDIQTGVYFASEGLIDFNAATRIDGCYFDSGYAYFTNLLITGSGYTHSSLAFQCSSNANMTLKETRRKRIRYDVTAPTGNTSVTRTIIPSGYDVDTLTGASSWGEVGNVVTVNVVHSSSQEVIIDLITAGDPFSMGRSVLGQMFTLFLLMMFIGLLGGAGGSSLMSSRFGFFIVVSGGVITLIFLLSLAGSFL